MTCHKMAVDCYLVKDNKIAAVLHVSFSKMAAEGHEVWDHKLEVENHVTCFRWLKCVRPSMVSQHGEWQLRNRGERKGVIW